MKVDLSILGSVEKPMLAIIVVLLLMLAWLNWQIAILATIVCVAILVFVGRIMRVRRSNLTDYLEFLATGVDQCTRYAVQNLPLAIAMVDVHYRVVWSNSVFKDWFSASDLEKTMRISSVMHTVRLDKYWGKSGFYKTQSGDKIYRVIYKYISPAVIEGSSEMLIEASEEGFMVFYYDDITEIEMEKEKAVASTQVFALLELDNIEDITKGISDVEYTNLWAQVNNIIVEEFDNLGGVIRGLTDASYMAAISRSALDEMIADNFSILDKVRAIHSSKNIPLTLSMGVAVYVDGLKHQGEKARSCLDLSLGRGGDQVTVFDGEQIRFFGGKTSSQGKGTRVRARVVSQGIRELIRNASNILIMGHEREDYDSIGGAIGVSVFGRVDNKPVHIIVSSQTNAIERLSDVMPSDPFTQELIISAEEAEDLVDENTLVFVVDVHRPDMVAAPKVLEKANQIVVIDHHRRSSDFIEEPAITYLEPASSSTSELVTELIQYYDENVPLSEVEASALYAGIVVDTKNFSVQTGSRTFDAASYLRRSGANLDVVRRLFMESFDSLKLQSDILSQAERIGPFAYASCPPNIQNASVVCARIADALITIDGVEASFVTYYRPDDSIGVSARSQGKVNVQVIMEMLGGGGHRTVAGAKLPGMTEVAAKTAIINAAKEAVRSEESVEKEK